MGVDITFQTGIIQANNILWRSIFTLNGLFCNSLPPIINSLKKQKTLYKVLTPSITPPYNFVSVYAYLWAYLGTIGCIGLGLIIRTWATLVQVHNYVHVHNLLVEYWMSGSVVNPLPTIGNTLKKQKSMCKALTPSVKHPCKFLWAYGSS